MSKSQWMELETLSNEIAHTQSRLDAARASNHLGLVQILERELADTLKKRGQVLADITNGLGSAGPNPKLVTKPVIRPEQAAVEEPDISPVRQRERVHVQQAFSAKEVQPQPVNAESDASVFNPSTEKGDYSMWDTLTRADIEQVKRALSMRRAEILTRHAEELKALEADQYEIDAFETAIGAFVEKFNLTKTAEVLVLNKERVSA